MASRTRLLVGIVAAIVLAALVVVPSPPVRAVVALLACVLLGVAGVETLAAQHPDRPTPLHSAAAALVSIVAGLMIVGFFLSLSTIGIARIPAAIGIAMITVLQLALAFVHRRSRRVAEPSKPERSRMRISFVVRVVGAVGVLAVALVLSIVSYNHWTRHFHFASLSAERTDETSIRVTVRNHEGDRERFRVVAQPSAGSPRTRELVVPDGAVAHLAFTSFPAPGTTVRLYATSTSARALATVKIGTT